MYKINFWFVVLTLLASLLQFSVFESWTLAGGRVAPQIFVAGLFFIFKNLPKPYLWWFVLLYYFFYDLISFSTSPGWPSLATIFFLFLLWQLRSKVLKGSLFLDLLFFVIISSFHFWLTFGQFDGGSVLAQLAVNFALYLIAYPFFVLLKRSIEGFLANQLSLKL